ncbi:hypothetical protein, partial [Saccharothrix sp. NRRL B-16314]|uniref:hypothetical protein n=1 Tax=Saccharothrix sp. NRRL B-16314 TaxID=1463825 RepID=UPI001E4EAEE4
MITRIVGGGDESGTDVVSSIGRAGRDWRPARPLDQFTARLKPVQPLPISVDWLNVPVPVPSHCRSV